MRLYKGESTNIDFDKKVNIQFSRNFTSNYKYFSSYWLLMKSQ